VTRISGVARGEREDLASRMKRALGCGATIEGDDVVLLGDLVERAALWLEGNGARRVVRGN
jgi:translation initiation factor 1